MKVVSNTTPIISLSSVGRLEILKDLYHEIILPEAVYEEIKSKEEYGYQEVEADFIKVRSVQGKKYRNLMLNQLDAGEAETILLATEINADIVIIDESIGYKIAKNAGLNVVRTLSILLKAKKIGILSEIKPVLDEMISKGRWYSEKVYKTILRKAGELPAGND